MKKLYLILIKSLLLIIVLISCQKENELQLSTHSNNLKTTKKIRFIGQWLNEGKRGKLVKDFCRQYEFKNQHLLIDLKFPEEIFENSGNREQNVSFVGELIKKSSPEWDIIRLNNQHDAISQYANDPDWAKKNLVDFSAIPEFKNNTSSKLLTQQVKDAWGGIIPGPFLEGSYWAVWSNKKVADKIGINIKPKGMTFDDFIGYIKAVEVYNKNNGNDYIVPIHEAADWQTMFAFAFQLYTSALSNSSQLFNPNVTEDKLQAWSKTLQALEMLGKQYAFDPNWQSVNWEKSKYDLVNGDCLFYINGSWMYNIWESAYADKLIDAYPNEFPVFRNSTYYPSAYFITWGVLKNSPNKEEAVKLLLAMNTPDVAEMWVQYTKCPTGIKGRLTDLTFGSDQFENFSNYIQNNYGSNIYNYSEELSKYVNGNSNAASTYYREVLTSEMSAEQAMKLIRNNIN